MKWQSANFHTITSAKHQNKALLHVNLFDLFRGAISFLDKKRSRFKRDILSRKDARLCKFLTVLETNMMHQPGISRISEALFSIVSLYGCDCARNEPTLSVVRPRS